jgi:hypothetical protein
MAWKDKACLEDRDQNRFVEGLTPHDLLKKTSRIVCLRWLENELEKEPKPMHQKALKKEPTENTAIV